MSKGRLALIIGALLALSLAPWGRAWAQISWGSSSGGEGEADGYGINRTEQGTTPGSVDAMARRADKESDPRILEEVDKAMTGVDPRGRVDGLSRLSKVKDPKANQILLKALADPDTRVKIKAIDMLGVRQYTDGAPLMCQYLFLRSTESLVKLHIVSALGRMGDSRGTLPIMQYLQQVKDERSRGTAVFALGEISDTRANDLLSQIATNDQSEIVRKLAQEALQKIDGEIPSTHEIKTAENKKVLVPTDQRLSKLRELDAKMQEMGGDR